MVRVRHTLAMAKKARAALGAHHHRFGQGCGQPGSRGRRPGSQQGKGQ